MFWSKTPPVGMDLGSYALKSCFLENNQRQCSVWTAAREESTSLRARLQEMFKVHRRAKQVSMALDDPAITAGYLELAKSSITDLRVAILSAVVREIPFSLSDVELIHRLVPNLGGDSETQGIFFVAVPNQVIQEKKALGAALGLDVRHYEPAMFAQLRGFVRNHQVVPGEVLAVVSAGAQATNVMLMRDGHLYHHRSFRLGGSEFTRLFQSVKGEAWEEAERRKRGYSVADQRNYYIEPLVRRWLREVGATLRLAQERHSCLRTSRVVLTGGTACWEGLDRRLSEELEMQVTLEHWDRCRPVGDSCDLPFYDVALGMALRQ